MAEATIPVDPTNPGQVFACLGLMEAAEVLCGPVMGWFDLTIGGEAFSLEVPGGSDPVSEVIDFLAACDLRRVAPPPKDVNWPAEVAVRLEFPSAGTNPNSGKQVSLGSLPVELVRKSNIIPITHWADDLRSENMKTFAGQQVGADILLKLLRGGSTRDQRCSVESIFRDNNKTLSISPFESTGIVSARFGFDARGAWDALRAGTSLDNLSISVQVSPLVEVLCAIGLQYARPQTDQRQFIYEIWSEPLPVLLARPAVSNVEAILPGTPSSIFRRFRSHTGSDKYYKKWFFAKEETPI